MNSPVSAWIVSRWVRAEANLAGEINPYHAWLGYGVAGVIVLRLLRALGSERQAGLMRS